LKQTLSCLFLVIPYVRQRWKLAAAILAALTVEMAFNAAVPMAFGFILDDVLVGGRKEMLSDIIIALAVGVAVVSVVGVLRNRAGASMTAGILADIRLRLFNHLNSQSIGFFAKASTGDLMARFTTDLAAVETALKAAIPWAILPGLDVFAGTVLIFTIDWRLASIAVIAWPVILIGPKIFTPKVAVGSYERKQAEAEMVTSIQESLSTQPVIKIFNLGRSVSEKFNQANTGLSNIITRVGFYSSLVECSGNVGILILQVVVIGTGATFVANGSLTIGSLAAFQALFANLSASLTYLTQYFPTLVEASGGSQRIEELLINSPAINEDKPGIELQSLQRQIRFDQVSFGYTPEQMNLRDLNINIEAGKNVAFVGPSGSGKSTILNLVMRFYDPQQGSVFFDDTNLCQASLYSARSLMAAVFQESLLFDTTIMENIRFGRPQASDAEVIDAAKAAEVHDAIEKLSSGYATMVGERGCNLSGGQRQRVAIARAILRNPALLILDEATSALDPGTETAINSTLLRLARNRTTLSVTHRLASVVDTDTIYYLEDGKVLESGSFRELLTLNGRFKSLWDKQHGFNLGVDGSASITLERMSAIPIFANIDNAILKATAGLFTTVTAEPGKIVASEGEIGDSFYIIVRGKVEVLKQNDSEQAIHLATLTDGDFFGEISLVQAIPRTATVRAESHCVFLTLYRSQFLHMLKDCPEIQQRVQEIMMMRISSLNSFSGPKPL